MTNKKDKEVEFIKSYQTYSNKTKGLTDFSVCVSTVNQSTILKISSWQCLLSS